MSSIVSSSSINLSDKKPDTAALFTKYPYDIQQKVSDYITLFLDSYGRLIPLRFDTGRALAGIKNLCPDDPQLFNDVCRKLCISTKTASRYMKHFEEINMVAEPLREAALRRGFDLAESENLKLRDRLKEETKQWGNAPLSRSQSVAIFEDSLSSIHEEAANEEFEAAENRRVQAEQLSQTRKAEREAALSGNALNLGSDLNSSTSDLPEDEDDEESADEISGSVNTPRKGLRWFVKDWIGKGKNKQQIIEAVFAAYDRETSSSAKRLNVEN